jgi:hypothetical protein
MVLGCLRRLQSLYMQHGRSLFTELFIRIPLVQISSDLSFIACYFAEQNKRQEIHFTKLLNLNE